MNCVSLKYRCPNVVEPENCSLRNVYFVCRPETMPDQPIGIRVWQKVSENPVFCNVSWSIGIQVTVSNIFK